MKVSTKSSKSSTKVASKFANPYRAGGCYHAIVAALEAMGSNKQHQYDAFAARIQKDWEGHKAFSKKEARNEATGKNATEKLMQNVKVIQRKDYGLPLHEQNACVDLGYEGNKLWIRLNTKSKSPMLSGRSPKAAKAVVKVVKATKAVKGKATATKAASKPPILSGAEAVAFLTKGKKKAK